MLSIKDKLRITATQSRATERGELMRYFMEIINPQRKEAGFRPLTYARLGKILQGQDMKTLYYMKSMMSDLPNERAAKFFFWSLREQK